MPKIYFYEAFAEECSSLRQHLQKAFGNSITYEFTEKTIQEMAHTAPPAEIISIRTQSFIPSSWQHSIRAVLSRSTGYDHLIAYRRRTERIIPCGFLDEYASNAVAEQAIMLMMSLLRKLKRQMIQFLSFERDGITGGECAGRRLLVIGVGRIGSRIVELGKALGMNVRGVDIKPDKPWIEYVDKEVGLAWADVIVCAMNLTDENRGYFDYKTLKGGKEDVVFVNIARGELSPLAPLAQLLREGQLGGVGLDVFDDESTLAVALRRRGGTDEQLVHEVEQLMTFPNVILTPHNAFNTMEAVERKSEMSVRQIQHFIEQKDFLWKI
jgi:D-lactate dehydrogenase